uniref:Probetacellulin-like isoform X1 n=1 Tax=Petromyzon marinus TaxID=7757 RepID=A0AAJ7WPN1_PETMA|nr:probetacellulin-like isoform X1 [Petromyzon marinus]
MELHTLRAVLAACVVAGLSTFALADGTVSPNPCPAGSSERSGDCSEVRLDKGEQHFGECQGNDKHYCIYGECRFLIKLNTPTCICHFGHSGTRCEEVGYIYQKDTEGQKTAIVVSAVVVTIIIVAILLCICFWRNIKKVCRRSRVNQTSEEMTTMNEGKPTQRYKENGNSGTV